MVHPSGGDLATRDEPSIAPPPGTFSTTTCWPKRSENPCAKTRATTSVPPPGAKLTINLIGQVVGESAAARLDHPRLPPAASTKKRRMNLDDIRCSIGNLVPTVRFKRQAPVLWAPER